MKKKLFGIMLVLAVILFAGYTAYNSHGNIKLSNVTLANLEALAGENDNDCGDENCKKYYWSSLHDCQWIGTGDYRVCEENGPANSCSSPGDKTCECGRNCK